MTTPTSPGLDPPLLKKLGKRGNIALEPTKSRKFDRTSATIKRWLTLASLVFAPNGTRTR